MNLYALMAAGNSDGPTDEKAQKTYQDALKSLHEHNNESALNAFKKADKLDGGHCLPCQKQMVKLGIDREDWKTAELAATEMVTDAKDDRAAAIAHHELGFVLMNEGYRKHKEEFFARAHDEFSKTLAAHANFPDALFLDGKALAQLRQDGDAKSQFEKFLRIDPATDPDYQRAQRFVSRIELARANMAPAFAVTTINGSRLTMDDLQGKVVLLDFWATWCGPCREALPHIQNVAKKFQGQPLVILSISLDKDENAWKAFIAKNEMTWPQYRDGYFEGPIAKMFGVNAIPHTFTIDADGVLQEEHIGDASIEGKLNKLLVRARELQASSNSEK
jgi:thiol-disulfide isomerase/thioredoxin